MQDVVASCLERNRELIDTLREDEQADALYTLTVQDAQEGRMTHPVPGICALPSLCLCSGIRSLHVHSCS